MIQLKLPTFLLAISLFSCVSCFTFTSPAQLKIWKKTHNHHLPSHKANAPTRRNLSLSAFGDDMAYNSANLVRQNENFNAIKNVGGADTVNDIYVRDPKTPTFWFVGKVSRCTGTATLEQSIARQWQLIEQHAARLRPRELGRAYGTLQIWTAPADSEMEVAYNRPTLKFLRMEESIELAEGVKAFEVGFEGEVYLDNEEGFRTERTDDGMPSRPEIDVQKTERERASDGELDDLTELLSRPKD